VRRFWAGKYEHKVLVKVLWAFINRLIFQPLPTGSEQLLCSSWCRLYWSKKNKRKENTNLL